jgi:thiol-disulfide isomerase/thioredoxin
MTPTLAWGPFVAPLPLLLAFLAVAAGFVAARLVAGAVRLRAAATLRRATWVGALAARAGFVADWWPSYGAHPLSILDLRDGGFSPGLGIAAAVLVALAACGARPRLRKPLGLAFAAAALVWVPGELALLASAPPGPPLPAITLTARDGSPRPLAAFAGKPTVVNLWASWCGPCREEMPMLAQAQRAHPELNFVFVDEGEASADVEAFLAATQLQADNLLLDPRRELGARYRQHAYPTTLFFDAQGRLVSSRIGELSAATLQERLSGIGP